MTYRLLPLLVSGYVGIGWHDLQAAPPVGARVCDVGTRALDHLSLREAQCAVVESVALLQVLDPIELQHYARAGSCQFIRWS